MTTTSNPYAELVLKLRSSMLVHHGTKSVTSLPYDAADAISQLTRDVGEAKAALQGIIEDGKSIHEANSLFMARLFVDQAKSTLTRLAGGEK